MTQDYKYTQQEWDKAVGWGKVPEDREEKSDEKDINKIGGPDKTPPPR